MIVVYHQLKKKNTGKCFPQTREMIPFIKNQSHKHQNLCLNLQTPHKNLGVTCTHYPGAGKSGTRAATEGPL